MADQAVHLVRVKVVDFAWNGFVGDVRIGGVEVLQEGGFHSEFLVTSDDDTSCGPYEGSKAANNSQHKINRLHRILNSGDLVALFEGELERWIIGQFQTVIVDTIGKVIDLGKFTVMRDLVHSAIVDKRVVFGPSVV